ncbi:MAG: hypothetical protein RLY21_1531 [Planctomycetota bacterium]|jgi:uncharacterized iron-regulated protein
MTARQRRIGHQSPVIALALLACTLPLPSCTRYFATDPALDKPSGAVVPNEATAPRALYMFEGSTGRSLGWADVMAAASWADAIFIGERHDDPIAHAVQLAVFEDLAAGYPGTALALEHLERNEQEIVDRYLRGEIGVDEFIDSTKSRHWAGKDTWLPFFQPLVDAADEAGSPIVAANAPRDYVRRARTDGYAALEALPPAERANFAVPVLEQGNLLNDRWQDRWDAYQQRFRDLMGSGEDLADAAVRERLDSVFLSQAMWDGTMGASAADALDRGAPKVVLCAGCFHVERDGGTVLQFQAHRPSARVLTITVIDASSRRLRDEDRLAADIVIYGFPVDRKKPEAGGAEEGQPAQPAPPSQPAQAVDPTQSADPAQPSEPEPAAQPANPAQAAPAGTESPANPTTQPQANCR